MVIDVGGVTMIGPAYGAPGGGAGVTDGDKGDITVSSDGESWTIDAGSITDAALADMPGATVKGRPAGAAGTPTNLTQAQLTALFNVFTASLKGAVPAPVTAVGAFLRDDGTWAIPTDAAAAWGAISGSMAAQSDLVAALSGKLGTSGGTLQNVIETVTASSASGVVDCDAGLLAQRTLTGNTTFSFTNMDSGQSLTLHLQTGGFTVTWPAGLIWVGGSAPSLALKNVLSFWKVGSDTYGAYVGAYS